MVSKPVGPIPEGFETSTMSLQSLLVEIKPNRVVAGYNLLRLDVINLRLVMSSQ